MILYYHPLDDSFSAAMCDAAVDALTTERGRPRVVRLADEPIDRAELAAITHLVVIAPTWWGTLPAQLLDAMRELIGPFVDGDGDPAGSPLRTVARLTVVTSHGSSRLMNRVQGEPGLALWKHTVLGLCAPDAAFEWVALYKLDRSTDADRGAFLDRVRATLTPAEVTNA